MHRETGWFSRERVLVLTLLAATLLALYLCYLIAVPFLPSLVWGLAFAVVANPLHCRIERRIQNRSVAAALTVVLVAAVIMGPVALIAQQVFQQVASGVQSLNSGLSSGGWRETILRNHALGPVFQWVESYVDIGARLKDAGTAIAERMSSWVTGSVWAMAQFFITFFLLFYFLRDRRAVLDALRSLVPLSRIETDEVFQGVEDSIYATIYGTLTVALIQGVLGGLMFWWLGIPAPLVWGVVMAGLAIIPILGAFIVWIPAALFLLAGGYWVKALILSLWGAIAIGLIDNILYPVLVGSRLRLHTVPVFIAVVGGVIVFGTSGVIVGPIILAVTMALVDIWKRRTAGYSTAEEALGKNLTTDLIEPEVKPANTITL